MIKYLEYLKLTDKDKYDRNGIIYKSFEEALGAETSDREKENKMIDIIIINDKAKDQLPDELVPLKECAARSILSKKRTVYIALDKSEIYIETFDIENANYFIDYAFVFGDGKYYPSKSIVRSTLTGENVEIYGYIGCISGENYAEFNTKEKVLDKQLKYKGCDVYLCYDDIGMNLYPSSTLELI